MLDGKIDATVAIPSSVFELKLQGKPVSVLADFFALGLYTSASDISTTRELLKNRPGLVKAFLSAYCEGIGSRKGTKKYPLKEALQLDIEFLRSNINELDGKKAADFIDISLLKDLESEGFFTKLKR